MTTLLIPSRSRPAFSLRRCLPEAEFRGCPDLVITGVATDVDRIEPGHLFLIIDSTGTNATYLATQAVERGASGVIADAFLADVVAPQVIVSDVRSACARIAHALGGHPSHWLPVIGLTDLSEEAGANPFLGAILEADGRRVGTLLEAGEQSIRGGDARFLAASLTEMLDRRFDFALLSISPKSLADRAADGLLLDSALIGPGRSHELDSRVSLRAASRLVRSIRPGGVLAILEGDVESSLLAGSNLDARIVTYGLGENGDIQGIVEARGMDGTRFRLLGLNRERVVRLQPMGEAALLAALGAAALALDYGASDGAIVAGLESVTGLPSHREQIALVRRSA